MTKREFATADEALAVAKRMFWLAWKASDVFGSGFLQDKSDADEEAVWDNLLGAGDYPGSIAPDLSRPHADYVFGRMMKLGVDIEGSSVVISDRELSADYQSWCRTYPTNEALLATAVGEIVPLPAAQGPTT